MDMPRRAIGLSAAKVAKEATPGRYGDGAGLYLLVRSRTAKFWIFRYVRAGKMREIGLGSATGRAAVSLADARAKARDFYEIHKARRDPLTERNAGRTASAVAAAKATTFAEASGAYIAAQRTGWRNAKHATQWQATLATYAFPMIGKLPVQAVDTALVQKVLGPIWNEKPETARRLRGRIEKVLDYAKALGLRSGENPARWRGHLDVVLTKRAKEQQHHAALPYAEIGDFMGSLRAEEGTAARALEFTILCAARTSEVLNARWSEIDLAEKLWTVPGERMKAGKEHKVPLSARAIAILQQMPRDGDFVFSGRSPDRPLSNMVFLMLLRRVGRGDLTAHGFRSSFRVWCAEQTNFPSDVAEAALAHTISDKVVAAYVRTTFFDRRRQLMNAWAAYCGKPSVKRSAEVLPIGGVS
jgi:integrase